MDGKHETVDAMEEKMNAEKFLRQYQECRRRIARLEERIQVLDDLASHITPEMSSERVQSSHPPDKLGQLIARKVDIQTEIMGEIDAALDSMAEIEAVINQIEPVGYQQILQKRYIALETWEGIAEDLSYSPQWLYVLHKRALVEVDKIIN